MATISAAASTNWSLTTTWVGGVVPGNGDTAEAAGFTVPIDIDLVGATAVATITNTGGGGFTVPNTLSGTRTITANLVGGTATLLTCSHTTGNTVAMVGNVTGGSGANASGVRNNSTGLVNITGNLLGGSNATAYGVYNASTGTVTITGNSTGATATGTYNAAGGTVNLTGNAYGSATAGVNGIANASSGTINVTGNAIAGGAANAYGVNNTSTGTVGISGYAKGGSAVNTFGLGNTGNGVCTALYAIGSDTTESAGIYAAAGSTCRCTYVVWGANGTSPVRGFVLFVDSPTLNKATVALVGGGTRELTFALGGAPSMGGHIVRRT